MKRQHIAIAVLCLLLFFCCATNAQALLNDNIMSNYHFNIDYNSSTNLYNLTPDSPSFIKNISVIAGNGSAYFNTTHGSASVTQNFNISNWTVSLWINGSTDFYKNESIFSIGNGIDNFWLVNEYVSGVTCMGKDNFFCFSAYNTSGISGCEYNMTNNINKNTHIVVVRDSTSLYKNYVNGVNVCNFTKNVYVKQNYFNLGRKPIGGNNDQQFNGSIDEVTTWNRSLTQTEINTLYFYGRPVEYPFVGTLNVTTRTAVGNASINNATTFYYIDLNDTSYNGTVNGTGSYLFYVVKNHTYIIYATPTNFSIANITLTPTSDFTQTHTYHYTDNTFFISVYNESSDTKLTVNTTLQVISDTYSANFTFSNGLKNLTLSPGTYTLRYWVQNTTAIPRDYYTTLTTSSYQNITLYVVDADISQYYLPILTDQNTYPISNATGQLLRYFIETNSYKVVEMAKTDTTGQAVFRLVPNTVFYKIIWTKDGRTISTTPSKITAQTNTYTMNTRDSPLASYRARSTLYKTLEFINATSTYVFTWSDAENIVSSGCLQVEETNDGVTNTVYESCSDGSTGSIPYTVTNRNNTYTANAWLTTSTEYSNIGGFSLTITPNTPIAIFGLVGIFIAIMLVIAFSTMGGESGTRGTVISGVFAILLISVYGIITYRPEVFVGLIIVAGVIVYKIRG